MPEAVLRRLLQVGVDGQLDPRALARCVLAKGLADLTADAVDDDFLGTLSTHQQLVLGLLDAGLADDRTGLDALVFGAGQLRLRHLADIAEQVRRHDGRILPGRDVLINDARQFGLARRDRE